MPVPFLLIRQNEQSVEFNFPFQLICNLRAITFSFLTKRIIMHHWTLSPYENCRLSSINTHYRCYQRQFAIQNGQHQSRSIQFKYIWTLLGMRDLFVDLSLGFELKIEQQSVTVHTFEMEVNFVYIYANECDGLSSWTATLISRIINVCCRLLCICVNSNKSFVRIYFDLVIPFFIAHWNIVFVWSTFKHENLSIRNTFWTTEKEIQPTLLVHIVGNFGWLGWW